MHISGMQNETRRFRMSESREKMKEFSRIDERQELTKSRKTISRHDNNTCTCRQNVVRS